MTAPSIPDRRPPAGLPAGRRRSVDWHYPFVLAGRELRGGVAGFRVFLACLVLGVTALAAIGSLRASVEAGISGEARLLLGGDVSARLASRAANARERRFLANSGTLSETVRLRAMARSIYGGRHSLIELQAVDDAYPLYGAVALRPAQPLAAALQMRDGRFGAVVEAALAARLALKPGDEFRIGEALLRLTGTIERLPDAAVGFLAFGPRVLISSQALAATGLIRPGALVSHDYRLRLPAGSDPAVWIAEARQAFPEAGWQLRSGADASPFLQRLVERVGFFLGLVGVATLLVGGVGIGNAVALYIAGRTAAIATLKCLGAANRLVFSVYLLQILALASLGIAAGLVLGAALPVLAAPLVDTLLPVRLRAGIYPLPLLIAALCGLLVILMFALGPLAAIGKVSPMALFRDRVMPARRPVLGLAGAASGLAAAALAAVVVLAAPDRGMALWYVAGIAAVFVVFRLLAALIVTAMRRLPHPRRPHLR
ncbi:MAG: ABC transporter permease, partial [Thiohalocapsa sp.]